MRLPMPVILLSIFCLMETPLALAALGGPPLRVSEPDKAGDMSGNGSLRDPVHAPRGGQILGKLRSVPHRGYSVHEVRLEDPQGAFTGQKIREYVLPEGKVFAVSWRGPGQPDLSELLGSYLGEYKRLMTPPEAGSPRGRAPMTLRSRHMILQRSGHMRDVRALAFLPELLPEGIRPEDLN